MAQRYELPNGKYIEVADDFIGSQEEKDLLNTFNKREQEQSTQPQSSQVDTVVPQGKENNWLYDTAVVAPYEGARKFINSSGRLIESLGDTLGEATNFYGVALGDKANNGLIELVSYDEAKAKGLKDPIFGELNKQDFYNGGIKGFFYDPAHPENEGKVFLFQYGKKIYDKMMDVMQPQFQDEQPVNPFDLWEGANFKLKIRNVEGYRNYDKSEFDKPTAVANGDESELESIYSKVYSLKEFTDPKTYKSYEELKAKLERVLGGSAPRTTAESVTLDEQAASPSVGKVRHEPITEPSLGEDEDDTLSYFSKLANEA